MGIPRGHLGRRRAVPAVVRRLARGAVARLEGVPRGEGAVAATLGELAAEGGELLLGDCVAPEPEGAPSEHLDGREQGHGHGSDIRGGRAECRTGCGVNSSRAAAWQNGEREETNSLF